MCETAQPLSDPLQFYSHVQSNATEINPNTMNLPQDTIIKVGRGGVSNQGNKKGENRTYFNQETRKLSKRLTKHTHNKQHYHQTPQINTSQREKKTKKLNVQLGRGRQKRVHKSIIINRCIPGLMLQYSKCVQNKGFVESLPCNNPCESD